MANELLLSINDGIDIYQNRPKLYYRMLIEGIGHIQYGFSWKRAAHEYVRSLGL